MQGIHHQTVARIIQAVYQFCPQVITQKYALFHIKSTSSHLTRMHEDYCFTFILTFFVRNVVSSWSFLSLIAHLCAYFAYMYVSVTMDLSCQLYDTIHMDSILCALSLFSVHLFYFVYVYIFLSSFSWHPYNKACSSI